MFYVTVDNLYFTEAKKMLKRLFDVNIADGRLAQRDARQLAGTVSPKSCSTTNN